MGQWFESWFDSPWYPILYSHRDYAEAEAFVEKLLEHLSPGSGARFLDLACGRGRHSRTIHAHGYEVMGIDLSEASIADARLHEVPGSEEVPGLEFNVHDMRKPFPDMGMRDLTPEQRSRIRYPNHAQGYSYILNLFTSFGYFEDPKENELVLKNVADALDLGGTFVLDFFNLHKVLREMVPGQEIDKDGAHFSIRKRYEDGFIIKNIEILDEGQTWHFEERVQGLDLPAFEKLFQAAGLEIREVWGDYQGGAFDPDHSPRLILFAGLHFSRDSFS
jgi:SAM-dependent methyltransferase